MKSLLLLRHATTEGIHPGSPDRARRLTPDGTLEAVAVGEYLRGRSVSFDVIICSPATRVQQTVAALQLPAPVVTAELLYDAAADEIIDMLRTLDDAVERVLVVGHAPGLPAAVQELADPGRSDPRAMATIQGRFPAATLASMAVPGPWADLRHAVLMSVRLA